MPTSVEPPVGEWAGEHARNLDADPGPAGTYAFPAQVVQRETGDNLVPRRYKKAANAPRVVRDRLDRHDARTALPDRGTHDGHPGYDESPCAP
jgi:hypothetical protein